MSLQSGQVANKIYLPVWIFNLPWATISTAPWVSECHSNIESRIRDQSTFITAIKMVQFAQNFTGIQFLENVSKARQFRGTKFLFSIPGPNGHENDTSSEDLYYSASNCQQFGLHWDHVSNLTSLSPDYYMPNSHFL